MPAINIIISEMEYKKLQTDYEKTCATWAQQGRQSLPPPFEHWAGHRMMAAASISADDVEHTRLFTAIEKLVMSLTVHGFCLAHLPDKGSSPAKSSLDLAQALARHFDLPNHYVKRLQEMFIYYLKSADRGAGHNPANPTVHTSTAIEQAYQEFLERTTRALDHLGSERAIGRAEGAMAILVSLQVMDRDLAQKKTNAFKLHARSLKQHGKGARD